MPRRVKGVLDVEPETGVRGLASSVVRRKRYRSSSTEVVTLHEKLKVGAVAALGAAAFVAGRARGRVSGIREALGMAEAFRYAAECRAEEEGGVCQWVYPRGHPRAGEPFGERPDGEPLHPFERDARRYRPFAGLPLLETVEFDAARPLPPADRPPDAPPWWQEDAEDDPRATEYREHLRREDERVARQRWVLQRLRGGRLGGLLMEPRAWFGPTVGADRSLRLSVEVRNGAPTTVEVKELRLTYLYKNAATELLRGRAAPRAALPEFGEGGPSRALPPGGALRWSAEIGQAGRRLAEHGMRVLPTHALPRPGGLLYRVLPRTGMAGRIGMERLRELNRRRLAVELVDVRGGRRKAGVEFVPPRS